MFYNLITFFFDRVFNTVLHFIPTFFFYEHSSLLLQRNSQFQVHPYCLPCQNHVLLIPADHAIIARPL